jgi:ribonucleoside-diphosphate reductase alpha chain
MIEIQNVTKTSSKIAKITKKSSEPVYDITVRDTHRINANGFYTSNCHHPDIRTFINIKRDLKRVTGANISIKLTDEFMNAVRAGENFQLRFPVEKDASHIVLQEVSAVELWNEIIDAAWQSAEPGLLFWDTALKNTPSQAYASQGFNTISTNPCAEIFLSPYDSCRLLLVNLSRFIVNKFTSPSYFDFDRFHSVTIKAQRLMDDLVDLEIEAIDKIIEKVSVDPEPNDVKLQELILWRKIKTAALNGRRTGLGITALGDALAFLNIKYGSDESITMTESMYKALAVAAYTSTIKLAKERGNFDVFSHDLERDHPFVNKILAELPNDVVVDYLKYGRRNIALTTTAPAGSVSIMTQTTSGCEPVYQLSYKRRKKINQNDVVTTPDFVDQIGDKWKEFIVIHHGLKEWLDVTNGSIEQSPYWGSTSADIDWVKKIDMQAAAQKWICHAISNTCNLPSDVTIDTVKQVYMRGWETGCKGVTIYRDGSRSGVLVSDADKKVESIKQTSAPKRPKELQCDIHRASIQGESYIVLVGLLDEKPYEIFAGLQHHVEVPKKIKRGTMIKNGKNKDGVVTYNLRIPLGDDDELVFKDIVDLFANPNHGAFTRTISLALRHGVPVQYLVEQLRKDKNSDLFSFSSVIARVFSKNYVPDGTKATQEKKCPDCSGTNLQYQQGCVVCMDCGSSKCS